MTLSTQLAKPNFCFTTDTAPQFLKKLTPSFPFLLISFRVPLFFPKQLSPRKDFYPFPNIAMKYIHTDESEFNAFVCCLLILR